MKVIERTEIKRILKVTKEEDTILHKAYDILNHIENSRGLADYDEDAYTAICGMRKVFEKMVVDVPTCPPTGFGVPSRVPARDEKGRFVKKETISEKELNELEDLLCGKPLHPEDLEDEEPSEAELEALEELLLRKSVHPEDFADYDEEDEDEEDEEDEEFEDGVDIDGMPEMKSGKDDYEEFIKSCREFIDALKR